MDNKYILAIDGGTQSSKVAIFDLLGNEMCSYTVPLKEIVLYEDGRAEHPDDDLWTSLQQACKKTLSIFTGNKEDIIGVGLGSIRCCRVLMKEDGDLAAPVQSWMDIRLSKPYEHEDDEVKYISATTGYLTYRLTGERKDTRSNYVGPWPIDPVTLEWYEDEEMFSSFNTPRHMLFELTDPSTILGYITQEASEATHIPINLPVVCTANDKAVEGLGAGLKDDGTVLISLGTYITSMMVGREYKSDTTSYWTNPGATKGEFLYESNGIRRGMSTVSWMKDLLGSDILIKAKEQNLSPEAYLELLAAEVNVGSDGLYTVLHWLAQPGRPHERGIMIGFNGSHKGPHMFRSILEGIAMTMKGNVLAMCEERGITLKNIIVSGGGSNGDVFMQILADVCNVRAMRNAVSGSASIGAAICASLALLIYTDRDEAIDHMVHVKDVFTPIKKNVALYKEIDEKVYKHIAPVVDGILKVSHDILFT